MKVRWMILAVLCGLVSFAALAHGDKVHVKGTIEKINSDSVQIKTQDGKSVEVKLRASTVYLLYVAGEKPNPGASTNKPAKVSDLAIGDLVVIHATPKGDALEADEVKFSVPGANNPPSAAQKPKS